MGLFCKCKYSFFKGKYAQINDGGVKGIIPHTSFCNSVGNLRW